MPESHLCLTSLTIDRFVRLLSKVKIKKSAEPLWVPGGLLVYADAIGLSSKNRSSCDQRHNEQDQEYNEQDSCELSGGARDAAKSECCCDHRYQKKYKCIV